MATVYVGSARSDENGKAYGGKAGDQKSGREVSTQAWYKHSKGWRVFRAKDPAKAAKIAECMEWACASPLIGYDQWQRNTLYNALEPNGFKLALSKAVETDCSALVRVCMAYAGITGVPSDFRTWSMPAELMKTGAFVELKGTKYTNQSAYLGAGDILVTPVSGHTVVVLNNGDKYEGTVQEKVWTLGERLLKVGAEGEDVRLLQKYLLKLGYSVGAAGTDGEFGSKTADAVKAFQADHGLDDDGEYGELTHAALMDALDLKPADTPQITPEGLGNLTVKAGTWNLRTGPGTAYPVAAVVKGGGKLSELSAENWVPIKHDGETLWISKNALEG